MAQDSGLLTPPKSSSIAETDELLSQLAGSEIDRLLKEAEGAPSLITPSTKVHPATPVEPVSAPETASVVESDIEKLLQSVESPLPSAPFSQTPTPLPPDADKPGAPSDSSEKAALLAAAGFDTAAPPIASSDEPAAPARFDGERAAILNAAGFEDTSNESMALKAAFAQNHVEEESAPEPYVPLPVYLKPLEVLSRPLNQFSPRIRIALGRIAFATLFNAIAVITYVRFFRKH